MAIAWGGVAGDWNRAGQAHSGEAKGPNVGGRSAPFFWPENGPVAPVRRRRPAGAEQGGSGIPRRVSTIVRPNYVPKRRIGSVGLACDHGGHLCKRQYVSRTRRRSRYGASVSTSRVLRRSLAPRAGARTAGRAADVPL